MNDGGLGVPAENLHFSSQDEFGKLVDSTSVSLSGPSGVSSRRVIRGFVVMAICGNIHVPLENVEIVLRACGGGERMAEVARAKRLRQLSSVDRVCTRLYGSESNMRLAASLMCMAEYGDEG